MRILHEDPELGDALGPGEREQAADECLASTMRVPRGRWAAEWDDRVRGGIGLLILDGLLLRRVGIDGRFGAELLGEGDLLRPWQGNETDSSLSQTTRWRALEATRLAVLDVDAARCLAAYPEVTGSLVGRALGPGSQPLDQHGDRASGSRPHQAADAPLASRRSVGPGFAARA